MKVTLTIVPPGGGEADFSLEADVPALPRAGEYILIRVTGDSPGAFRVLYVTHEIETKTDADGGFRDIRYSGVDVQVEPVSHPLTVRGPMKRLFDFYNDNPRWSGKVHEYPESGY